LRKNEITIAIATSEIEMKNVSRILGGKIGEEAERGAGIPHVCEVENPWIISMRSA
jgi:hypothetical protein